MSIHDDGTPRPSTHVRVVACHPKAMPSPEIRALARLDLSIDDEDVHRTAPVMRRFGTIADEGHTLRTCTPMLVTQTIWTPAQA